MPRLARRAPLCRSTRKPATLVVPRSTARPSVRRARRRKPDQLAFARRARAATSRCRAAPSGSCRAAARSTAGSGLASARITRSRSRQIVGERGLRNADVAGSTTAGSSGSDFNGFAGVEFGPHHRRQRARGNLHRAVGFRRDLAGAQPARFFCCRPRLSARRRSLEFCRRQHAPAGAASAAAAAGADDAHAVAAGDWKMVSPGMAGDVAVQLREAKL